MRKAFNVFLVFLITLFTIPFGGLNVSAEETKYDNIEDGEYNLTAKLLKEGTDEASAAAGFMSDQVTLKIQDGNATITFFIPNNPAMEFKAFELEGEQPQVESGTGQFNDEEVNGNYYTFPLDPVKANLTSTVTYSVDMPPTAFDHEGVVMDIQLVGLDELPTVPLKEDENLIQSPDKSYKANYKSDLDLERYFKNPVTIVEKDGKTYVQMNGVMGNMLTSLTINGEEVTWGSIKEDGSYTIQFEITGDLEDELEFTMHIDTGNPDFGQMEHTAKLWFEKIEDEKGDPKDDSKSKKGKDEKEPKPTPKPKKPSKKDLLTPDKAYKIDYTILHEDGTKPSVADSFFEKPGILLEKDGIKYLQMTVENGDMVRSLSNEYGEYILVDQKSDGTKVMQLRVPSDLSDMELDMHIVVPEGAIPGFPGYDESHGAILTFGDATEISVGNHMLAPSGDKNNLNGPYVEGAPNPDPPEGGNNGKQPDKPELGDNGDDKKGEKTDENPKTGDTSQILFFSTLLVASLSVLVLQVRRRLAA